MAFAYAPEATFMPVFPAAGLDQALVPMQRPLTPARFGPDPFAALNQVVRFSPPFGHGHPDMAMPHPAFFDHHNNRHHNGHFNGHHNGHFNDRYHHNNFHNTPSGHHSYSSDVRYDSSSRSWSGDVDYEHHHSGTRFMAGPFSDHFDRFDEHEQYHHTPAHNGWMSNGWDHYPSHGWH